MVAVRTRATRQFYETVREATSGGGELARAGRVAWNLLPVLVILLTVYAFIGRLVAGWTPQAVAANLEATIPLLEGGLLALLVACLIQWPLAERLIERRIRTSLGLLEGVVEDAVEECLGQGVVHSPERTLGEVLERHRDFQRLRDDARRILKEDPDPRSVLSAPPEPPESERPRSARTLA